MLTGASSPEVCILHIRRLPSVPTTTLLTCNTVQAARSRLVAKVKCRFFCTAGHLRLLTTQDPSHLVQNLDLHLVVVCSRPPMVSSPLSCCQNRPCTYPLPVKQHCQDSCPSCLYPIIAIFSSCPCQNLLLFRCFLSAAELLPLIFLHLFFSRYIQMAPSYSQPAKLLQILGSERLINSSVDRLANSGQIPGPRVREVPNVQPLDLILALFPQALLSKSLLGCRPHPWSWKRAITFDVLGQIQDPVQSLLHGETSSWPSPDTAPYSSVGSTFPRAQVRSSGGANLI